MSKSSEVILASAGTGKTFRLAGTFLKLLFDGKMPDKILATTFTRKASGEILDRVLGWLALATGDKDELHDLRKATGCFDESIINEKTCEELLTRLVRNLDTFNVRTLDSFFVEAAKVYAFELGMSVGWTICEDVEDARLRSDALIELFATNKPEVLNNLLIGISEMSPMRSVHGGSLKLLKNSLDILRNSDKSAWEVIQPGKEMLSDSELASLQEAFSKLDIPKTGGGTPNKHFTKNHRLLADILAENSWPAFLSNSIVQNISKGEEKFARITIPEGWQNLLGCLIPHAKNMLLKRLHFRNQSLYEFLCLFQDSYHSLKHRSGSYRFEDFPKALAKEQKLADSKHSSFRLGRSIRHLLLDEFQDTSVTQWQVLQPIVERVIENRDKTSLFCVGDVKQSIYGWRDGEPRLLQELGERQDLYIETMEASWRSSQTVLDAVNLCFGNLSGNEALMGTDSSFLSEAEKWDETFNDHVSAKPKLLGKVVLRQNPAPGNADENRAMAFRIAADRAEELQEKHSGASIGILVRRNASGNRIIKLLQDRGIPASGEGGNPLTDSKTVLSVLALLHLADHPGDSAAAFHVGSSFLAQEYNLSTEAQSEEKLIKVAKRTRRETQEKGFGAWTEGILKLAEQNELSEWDRQRMQQFIDLAYSYETKAGLRCSEFVDFVREKKVENPNSAPIKVMTIHQSKGLEFDIVILPELGGGIPGTLKTLLTARPQSGSNLETVSFTASKALVSIHPILEKMYNAQKGFLFREQMCVLYVAMTRAKHHLEMIVPALKPNAAGDKKLNRNIGCLLRAAFPTELDSVEDVLWQSPTAKEEWRKGR
ncbi:MAG: UvrD-helicase domain-containing protein, partial [Planctomycetota bacterium]|nr:UvrD-helicase domain-containing protein [Planctomycetota bacterium]